MQSDVPDFETLLRETTKSAVLLEMRGAYGVGDES